MKAAQIFVQGYVVERFEGDKLMETLYGVLPDGRVKKSNEHRKDSFFDRKGRTWEVCAKLPEGAIFIGRYPLPA